MQTIFPGLLCQLVLETGRTFTHEWRFAKHSTQKKVRFVIQQNYLFAPYCISNYTQLKVMQSVKKNSEIHYYLLSRTTLYIHKTDSSIRF